MREQAIDRVTGLRYDSFLRLERYGGADQCVCCFSPLKFWYGLLLCRFCRRAIIKAACAKDLESLTDLIPARIWQEHKIRRSVAAVFVWLKSVQLCRKRVEQ